MTYLIAEVGSTHDGSLGNALRSVQVFAESDAIKFQDHRWQKVRPGLHPSPHVRETRELYYRRTAFGPEQWDAIKRECRQVGADLIVSPFSVEAAREQADRVDAFKVASGEVTNLPLLAELRAIGKPVHLSSGMSDWPELDAAVEALGPALRSVMHCVSLYPTPPEKWALRGIQELQVRYPETVVGYSDHSAGTTAPVLAAYMGASVVEVHVTLSRSLYGSDAWFGLEPQGFSTLRLGLREAWEASKCRCPRSERVRSDEIQQMREVFTWRE